MTTITIEISKKKHYKLFLNFLKELNFPVKIISSDSESKQKTDKLNSEKEKVNPDVLFGLWEGKDITLEKLREKAWKRN